MARSLLTSFYSYNESTVIEVVSRRCISEEVSIEARGVAMTIGSESGGD